jgi:hypothetical protein
MRTTLSAGFIAMLSAGAAGLVGATDKVDPKSVLTGDMHLLTTTPFNLAYFER